ncbi:MSMEG_0570 family nitrogen starvation response protein [Zobellia roscoffensis]|uniref:MSMEG_0570 family nitrogen starvation response protein n=1 Tax=Zobellia roscoffensis TaxID=2779508 RepID=UPI00188B96C1|nr:MSMEG_0570 family nitrogen starvation response protein [Zobellia roscoffensis]
MPITYVNIEWPDNQKDQVYSPSSVINEYLKPGESLSLEEFLTRCTTGLNEASERVRLKFGYSCTSAQAESSRISEKCQNYDAKKIVKIV